MMLDPEVVRSKVEEIFGDPYDQPTDIVGFRDAGKSIAEVLLPIIGEKEICFFDEEVKSDPVFHFLEFADMLQKTAIMIFTVELPEKYSKDLEKLNKKAKIFIPKELQKTIARLKEVGLEKNLILF